MTRPPRLSRIKRSAFARVLTSILIGLMANSTALPPVQASTLPPAIAAPPPEAGSHRLAAEPVSPLLAETAEHMAAVTTQTSGFLCGLGGACLETGADVLSLPERLLVIPGNRPWDRVVKGSATTAWQPLEFEARQTLSALHGVPNDSRLPHFAADEIRAVMLNRLLGIALKNNQGQALTSTERAALQALSSAVVETKARPARLAIEEYNEWVSYPCGYSVPRYPDGLTAAERQAIGPHAFDEYNPGTTCQERLGTLFGTPNPPTVEQFVSYGALRASSTFASADSQAAAARTFTGLTFMAGIAGAAVLGGVAALVTAASPAIALALGVTFGSFAAPGLLSSGLAAAGIGVGAAASIVAVVIVAVVVTVVATVQQVERENLLPTLQAKLSLAQQAPDIHAMTQDQNQLIVLFTAFMGQTLPDYSAERLGDATFPIPQSRPSQAPRFNLSGTLVDSIVTLGIDNIEAYRQTFMADGWFVTRTSANLADWTPWRWALSFQYGTSTGRRIAGIQPDGFLDAPGALGTTAPAANKTLTIGPSLFDASGPVTWTGNRSPTLSPTSSDPDISAGSAISFVSGASDPDGTVAAIRWYVDDGTFSNANTKSVAACGFDPPPLDPSGLPTVCPWRAYDDAGAGISVTFGAGGVRHVRVVARDNAGASSAQQFTVNVGQLTPSIALAEAPPTAITEGQPITLAGTFDLPRLPEGYFTNARFTLDWGDGTRIVRDRPCWTTPDAADPTAPGCAFQDLRITNGEQPGPWTFVASKTFAFRPDRPGLAQTPLTLSVRSGQGVVSGTGYQVAVTNVQPTVALLPVCEDAGLLFCDRTITDSRRPRIGDTMALRGYVNDVPAGAHSITVLWGDGTSSNLQPGCSEPGCPMQVETGPVIPLFTSPYPWKRFGLTHTYTELATFPVKVMVNDGGPQGVVSVHTNMVAAGIGALTGPTEFAGPSRQSFTLQRSLTARDVFAVSDTSCGSGTLASWENATGVLTCDFPEVSFDSESEVHVVGTYNGSHVARALVVTTIPVPLAITSLSGPQSVSIGGLAAYVYEVSGPGPGLATMTVTPNCGFGSTLWSTSPGSFTCLAGDIPSSNIVSLAVDNTLEQSALRGLHVDVVPDTVAPSLGTLPDVRVNSTGHDGAAAFYFTGVSDNDWRGLSSIRVSCTRQSGSLFPVGTTPVACSATDRSGNTANASFSVTVVDVTAPTLSTPLAISVNATSPAGAVVSYALPAATDAPGIVPVVSCQPNAGSTFPIGSRTVTCAAADAAGNRSQVTFQVEVLGATPQVTALHAYVQGLTIDAKMKRQMLQTLEQLQSALAVNDVAGACTRVRTIVSQTTKDKTELSPQQRQTILSLVSQIGAVIGC